MSSWVKSPGSGRRPQSNPNGSAQPLRNFRRAAPYPMREDRGEEHKVLDSLESYEELEQQQQQDYNNKLQYDGYQHHQHNAKPEVCSTADKRKSLYQKFYRQVQEERKPADCVVLSVTNQSISAAPPLHTPHPQRDYPKSLGQCLQERGLSVDMLYLQAEQGLTRALQDVRAGGSPLCILVEQTNIALCSCTVIIFSESLKIHRNMPKEQALDFVLAEYRRGLANERPAKDPAEMAARASELLGDFLEREKLERHAVPSDTRQLLRLLADGLHLYPEELGTAADYLRARQDHAQASAEGERSTILPPGLGKPPPLLPTPSSSHAPLLPTPSGPPQSSKSGLGAGGLGGPVEHHQLPHSPPTPLMASPASYPKSKPPPLLSMPRPSPHGLPAPLGPPSSHGPYGPPPPRGLSHHHAPPYHPGPRGPPSLKSLHMGLAGPLQRPNGPRR